MRKILLSEGFPFRFSVLLSVFILGFLTSFSQGKDSKGKDFWVMFNGNLSSPEITVFITSDVNTSGIVSIPGMNFIKNYTVTANTVTPVVLPVGVSTHLNNTVDKKGVHITALHEVTVYGLNYAPFTTDAFLSLPTDVLGLEYIVLTYGGLVARSQFGIVSPQNGTNITITPSVSAGGRAANVPYTITLNEGETYELTGGTDMSGTRVVSNKPIGVMGSSSCANIPPNASFCDHIVEMIPPIETYGKKFATVPLRDRINGDTWRFMASENGTTIKINGVAEPAINKGQWREKILTAQSVIESDKPIMVAQYSNGSQFSGNPGDPFMMLIPSLEQFLAKYTLTTVSGYVSHYINIVAPSSVVGSLTLDGAAIPSSEFTAIGSSGFSGAKVKVNPGTHNLSASLPFGVFQYGFNQDDSYGYPGGQSFAPIASVNSIQFSPNLANVIIGTEVCGSATVQDQNGNPLNGVRVDFEIIGPHSSKSTFSFTGENGIATFCYTGTETGTDSIRATVGTLSDEGKLVWTKPADPTVYYSKSTGPLNNTRSWGVNPDGSGATPINFGEGKTFNLANRAGVYTMTNNWGIEGILHNPAGSQLFLNGNTLHIAKITGEGKIIGSPTSGLHIWGNTGSVGTLYFGTGSGGSIQYFTLDRDGSDASVKIGSPLGIIGALSIEKGTLNTNNMLTLKSTATNTARVTPVTGAIVGNVTVERYIPARRAWRMLNSPVGGNQTINQAWQEGVTTSSPNPNPNPGFGTHITNTSVANGFDINPGAAPSLKWFDVAANDWKPVPNTRTTTVGNKPFMLFVRGDRGIRMGGTNVLPTSTVLRATGPLNIGEQRFTVNPTGFTAIPNPYASPVEFKTVTRLNVPNSFYVWDPKLGGANGVGAYVNVSYNGQTYDVTPSPVSPISSMIQSGQSILVRANGNTGTLIFKESDKTYTDATNVFSVKPEGKPSTASAISGLRINLRLSESNGHDLLDGVYTSYSSTFSNDIDEMDAVKSININENLAMVRGGQNLIVERRSLVDAYDTIYLSVSNTSAGPYVLEFDPLNMATGNMTATLVDNYLQTTSDIRLNDISSISFTVNSDAASYASSRFTVLLAKKGIESPDMGGDISISTYPNPVVGNSVNLKLANLERGTYQVELYNSIGQVIYRKTIQHTGGTNIQVLNLNRRFANGIYQLQVKGNNIRKTLKVISKN